MSELKVLVRIRMGRSSGRDGHSWHVDLIDDGSSIAFCSLEMTGDEYAQMLTSMEVCVPGVVRGLQNVGKISERSDRVVPRPRGHNDNGPELDAALAAIRAEGWEPRESDAHNHHNWLADNRVGINVFRFVDRNP